MAMILACLGVVTARSQPTGAHMVDLTLPVA